MIIRVELPTSSEAKLIEEAGRQGKSIESYAAELLQRALDGHRSFAQILAPLRNQVAESGLDDVSLDQMLEQARNGE